ncbi:MAG: hypothetical protein P0Y56_10225 [Candidatus Andeanibacterium colombiense]|uniref:Uncharacterized protein n=1 Tax=Candidatus Andeanibacterium colombiense TaxID=3121345 RepID=A0AAJ6BLU6_9SPHN|nr:MAG: hypothetical protein P0Y56_10225 [Sphingomonadaceae bacterium]
MASFTRPVIDCAKTGLAAAYLLAAVSGQTALDIPQIPAPAEAAERLRQCGFETVEVSTDDELQEDVLIISGIESTSAEQIDCAAHVSIETYYSVLLPKTLNDLYQAAYLPLLEAQGRKLSRDWLEARGMLDHLPRYDPATMEEAAYADALEKFCGPTAKGALVSKYGPHALSPDWALDRRNLTIEQVGEAMMCLTSASSVSGFKVYLVGNEKIREP